VCIRVHLRLLAHGRRNAAFGKERVALDFQIQALADLIHPLVAASLLQLVDDLFLDFGERLRETKWDYYNLSPAGLVSPVSSWLGAKLEPSPGRRVIAP
jgi:hypothetical protein